MGELIALAIGAIFGAGGAMALLRGVRKDLNGLGKRVREDSVTMEFRTITSMLTTLALMESKEMRIWLVDKYLNSWRRP